MFDDVQQVRPDGVLAASVPTGMVLGEFYLAWLRDYGTGCMGYARPDCDVGVHNLTFPLRWQMFGLEHRSMCWTSGTGTIAFLYLCGRHCTHSGTVSW
jgi:hypothetical protein